MEFARPLMPGRLIQRYKRFLADIRLEDGSTITATCPNTGSMLGLTTPGVRVWVSKSDSPTRKYPHTWEAVEADLGDGPVMVGINTSHPNGLVSEAVAAGRIPALKGYASLRREVKYGENSRIDLLLEDPRKGRCYVEIKNVHMMRKSGLAEFPDSVTERGLKHLRELANMVAEGHRAVMIYLIQRSDAKRLAMATDIDLSYAEGLATAMAAGVEALGVVCALTPTGISLVRRVPLKA